MDEELRVGEHRSSVHPQGVAILNGKCVGAFHHAPNKAVGLFKTDVGLDGVGAGVGVEECHAQCASLCASLIGKCLEGWVLTFLKCPICGVEALDRLATGEFGSSHTHTALVVGTMRCAEGAQLTVVVRIFKNALLVEFADTVTDGVGVVGIASPEHTHIEG